MSSSELTASERVKVVIKYVSALAWRAIGGFELVRLLSKPGVTIVAYHRIIDDDHEGVRPYISVKRRALGRQIQFFKRHYVVISLAEAIDRIRDKRLDAHYLVITFDDGYRDNHDLGLDVFRSEAVQPAIFITTDCVDKGQELWPDGVRRAIYAATLSSAIKLKEPEIVIGPGVASRIHATKAIIAHVKALGGDQRSKYLDALKQSLGSPGEGDRTMLDWNEVRALRAAGVTIGSHTVSHQVLSRVDEPAARAEIIDSKRVLEAQTGQPVEFFAYPNGTFEDFNDSTVAELQKAGYTAALTTIRGVNRSDVDLYRLRRTGIYLTDTLSVIMLKLAAESLLHR